MSDSKNLLNRLTSAEDDGRWLNEPARFEGFYWHANYCWLQFAAQGDPDARYSQVSAASLMGTLVCPGWHIQNWLVVSVHVMHMHTIELACLLYKVWIIQYNVLCSLPVHIVLHSSTYGSFKMQCFFSHSPAYNSEEDPIWLRIDFHGYFRCHHQFRLIFFDNLCVTS